jgi:hypothetical protein
VSHHAIPDVIIFIVRGLFHGRVFDGSGLFQTRFGQRKIHGFAAEGKINALGGWEELAMMNLSQETEFRERLRSEDLNGRSWKQPLLGREAAWYAL